MGSESIMVSERIAKAGQAGQRSRVLRDGSGEGQGRRPLGPSSEGHQIQMNAENDSLEIEAGQHAAHVLNGNPSRTLPEKAHEKLLLRKGPAPTPVRRGTTFVTRF